LVRLAEAAGVALEAHPGQGKERNAKGSTLGVKARVGIILGCALPRQRRTSRA
jgi:hypothetical protein